MRRVKEQLFSSEGLCVLVIDEQVHHLVTAVATLYFVKLIKAQETRGMRYATIIPTISPSLIHNHQDLQPVSIFTPFVDVSESSAP